MERVIKSVYENGNIIAPSRGGHPALPVAPKGDSRVWIVERALAASAHVPLAELRIGLLGGLENTSACGPPADMPAA